MENGEVTKYVFVVVVKFEIIIYKTYYVCKGVFLINNYYFENGNLIK